MICALLRQCVSLCVCQQTIMATTTAKTSDLGFITKASSVSINERSTDCSSWVQTQICCRLLCEAISQRAPRGTRNAAWTAKKQSRAWTRATKMLCEVSYKLSR